MEKISTVVIAVILVIGGIVFLGNVQHPNSPSEVVKSFIRTLEKGEVSETEIKNYITSHEYPDTFISIAGIDYIKEAIKHNGGIKKIDILKEDIYSESESAYVDFKIEFKNGSDYEKYLRLIKEEGKWKLTY